MKKHFPQSYQSTQRIKRTKRCMQQFIESHELRTMSVVMTARAEIEKRS
ncbi:hypothetical protein HMPREF1555_01274 [Porphyromonas gingivalis F0570]|uniref:Uncharacterized protein n=1 Tax=Porphyromonas gingivalis F0570 TaxID=1227271 RepID=A0A0E2LPY4_PORGN|nr:hypothetical protein HMPREF1555_01274 [Porphyromonas gingivalis F0570]